MAENPYTKQAEAGVHYSERNTKPVKGLIDKIVFGSNYQGADQDKERAAKRIAKFKAKQHTNEKQ